MTAPRQQPRTPAQHAAAVLHDQAATWFANRATDAAAALLAVRAPDDRAFLNAMQAEAERWRDHFRKGATP
jgi:hypothetical protein